MNPTLSVPLLLGGLILYKPILPVSLFALWRECHYRDFDMAD